MYSYLVNETRYKINMLNIFSTFRSFSDEKHAELSRELPNLVKNTMEKMLDSKNYADVTDFESTLREMLGTFDWWHDWQETANFFQVVCDGMWGAVFQIVYYLINKENLCGLDSTGFAQTRTMLTLV